MTGQGRGRFRAKVGVGVGVRVTVRVRVGVSAGASGQGQWSSQWSGPVVRAGGQGSGPYEYLLPIQGSLLGHNYSALEKSKGGLNLRR